MRWQNLQTNRCPYCASGLNTALAEIKCQNCFFTIKKERFTAIRDAHRESIGNYKKMRWQNILQNRCPMCNDDLIDAQGPYEIMKCISFMCDFKIRVDKIEEIINDKTHVAHMFTLHKKGEDEAVSCGSD